MRLFAPFAFAAIVLASGAARAETTYSCNSLNADEAVLTFSVDTDSAGVDSVTKLDVLVGGDFGYSTKPETPLGDRTRIDNLTWTNSHIGFQLFTVDPQYTNPIGEVGLASLGEGVYVMTAGVLQLSGGGLYPIECTIAYEGL